MEARLSHLRIVAIGNPSHRLATSPSLLSALAWPAATPPLSFIDLRQSANTALIWRRGRDSQAATLSSISHGSNIMPASAEHVSSPGFVEPRLWVIAQATAAISSAAAALLLLAALAVFRPHPINSNEMHHSTSVVAGSAQERTAESGPKACDFGAIASQRSNPDATPADVLKLLVQVIASAACAGIVATLLSTCFLYSLVLLILAALLALISYAL